MTTELSSYVDRLEERAELAKRLKQNCEDAREVSNEMNRIVAMQSDKSILKFLLSVSDGKEEPPECLRDILKQRIKDAGMKKWEGYGLHLDYIIRKALKRQLTEQEYDYLVKTDGTKILSDSLFYEKFK